MTRGAWIVVKLEMAKATFGKETEIKGVSLILPSPNGNGRGLCPEATIWAYRK